MAIVTGQAKLYIGVRSWCVDKNISANLSAAFSIGNKDIDFPTDVPDKDSQGNDVIYPNVYIWRLRRAVADMICPRPQPVLVNERYKTYGAGNNVIVSGKESGTGVSGISVTPSATYTLSPSDRIFEEIVGIASPSNANYSNPFYRAPSWKITYTTTGNTTYELKSKGQYISVGDTFIINSTINPLIPISTTITVTSVIPVPVVESGGWSVVPTLTCQFPTYIEIDVEKLQLPEGTTVTLNFEEGWLYEDRGRKLPSGAWEYPNAVQDSPSPEAFNYVTFRTPWYGVAKLNSVFNRNIIPLRIKQLAANFPQALGAVTFRIRYSPGRFASLFVDNFTSSVVGNFIHRPILTLYSFTGEGSLQWNPFPYRLRYFDSTFNTSNFTQITNIRKFVGFSIPVNGVFLTSTVAKKNTGIVSNTQAQFTVNQVPGVTRNIGNIAMSAQFAKFSIIGEIEQNTINMTSSFSQSTKANFNVASSKPALAVVSNQSTIARKRVSAISTINTTSTCEAGFDFVAVVTTTTNNYVFYVNVGGSVVKNVDWAYTNAPNTVTPAGTYTIFWGDGTSNTYSGTNYNITKTYARPGNYFVKIRGDAFYIQMPVLGVTKWLAFGEKVIQVGNIWGTDNGNLLTNPEVPDYLPTQVRSLNSTFKNLTNFNRSINNWNVSNIRDFQYTFQNCQNYNQAMNNWNPSSCVNMEGMFENCARFNQNIDSWDVSKVESFTGMFYNSVFVSETGQFGSFNSPLNSWNVSRSRYMTSMFFFQGVFNQPLSNWNVSNVTAMDYMFAYSRFRQNINTWNVGNVVSMRGMFQGQRQPSGGGINTNSLNSWNVSNVTDMAYMFQDNNLFNGDIGLWDTGSVTTMESMFQDAQVFNKDIGQWDVSSVTNMNKMFSMVFANWAAFNQDLSGWCVTNIPTQPVDFTKNTSSHWTLPKPVWGTCPP